jgi:hypothetical protein
MTISPEHQTPTLIGGEKTRMLAPALAVFCLAAQCHGQGTMTFRFEGQPKGTMQQVGVYTEAGVTFGPHGVGSLFLSGGGVAGYPDNGTGYLYIPDGYMTFNYPTTLPSTFNLVSFDAAEYLVGAGPTTLTVVGYKHQIMGPTIAVTNYFTLDGVSDGTGPLQDFQTFHPDSSFVNLFELDVLNSRFSLDNLVIGGVPEPSPGELFALGVLGGLGWRWVKGRRASRGAPGIGGQ